jgi:phosphoglycolate phosphatase-like HAD superfamily hydrolase
MHPCNLVVFDIDGVLIDVSASYREAVRKTARRFLLGAKNCEELPDPLFSLNDLALFKQSGGMNNDWELTARTLSLLFLYIEFNIENMYIPKAPYEKAIKKYDVKKLASFLKKTKDPLTHLHMKYGNIKSSFVEGCFQNDVKTGNIIKQIFQEIYLGSSLFRTTYGIKPGYWKDKGLINKETLYCDVSLLEDLAEYNFLAIATGRPEMEATYSLEKFFIRKYFKEIITLDEILVKEKDILKERNERGSLSKPNPYMLDYIVEKTGGHFQNYIYVGDMPDDMQAAKASKNGYQAVGVSYSSPDPQSRRKVLLNAGADYIIDNLAAMRDIID